MSTESSALAQMIDPVVAALAAIDAPWAAVAAAAAESKLGLDTLVLDVGEAITVTEHFVITNGRNSRQVKAIVNEVEHVVVENCCFTFFVEVALASDALL